MLGPYRALHTNADAAGSEIHIAAGLFGSLQKALRYTADLFAREPLQE